MKLSSRNYLPLIVEGSQSKLLPLYLYFLESDLEWANDAANQSSILQETQRLILENIEEIERKSKAEGKQGFTRLTGSELVSVAYSTKPVGRHLAVVQLSAENNLLYNNTNFSVHLWVFPFDQSNQSKTLPVDVL